IDEGQKVVSQALNAAEHSGYGVLQLRAIGFEAFLNNEKNDLVTASAWDRVGLFKYWAGSYPPVRAYQFYDDWSDQAQQASKWHLSAALEQEAVTAISSTSNRSADAMARFQLARSLSMIEESGKADEQVSLARNEFSKLPPDAESLGYLADAEVQLAN